jgi:hypothetical protein
MKLGTSLRFLYPTGEHDAMLRSFERIGEFLMPAIRDL